MNFKYTLRLTLVAILLAGIFMINSCEEVSITPNEAKTSLKGNLVDDQGNSVPSAQIEISNQAAPESGSYKDTTDENGEFYITGLPENQSNLKIKVIHPDFKIYGENLSDFKQKSSHPVMIYHHDSCTGTVRINTRKSSDSTNLDSVEIRLYRNGALIRKDNTENGYVLFDSVCTGTYIVRLYKIGYGLIYDSVNVQQNDTILRNYYMVYNHSDSCCHGVIYVTPKDTATGSGLSGTSVSLYKNNSLLNTYTYSGTPVYFSGLCQGTYYVHLSKSGYNGAGIAVNLGCNDTVRVERALAESHTDSCCKGTLKIMLKDRNTGNAPTYQPTIKLLSNNNVLQTVTAQNGYAYINNLCQGSYSVQISSEIYETLNFDYTSHCNQFDTTTKYLTPKHNSDSCCHGKIVVSIRDSVSNDPIDTVKVQISLNGAVISYAYTSNGKVEFTGLCQGSYVVYYLGKTGWIRESHPYWTVQLGCNDSVGYVRYMTSDQCCHGKITVFVKDSTSGNGIDSASVILSQNGTQLKTVLTSHGGYATFTDICPGTYSFYYYRINWYRTDSPSWNITMGCNDTVKFTKVMLPNSACCNGSITGTVSDSTNGALLANAYINLYQNNTKISTVHTDANGYFSITGLCPGSYTLSVYVSGYKSKNYNTLNLGCNDTSNNLDVKLSK